MPEPKLLSDLSCDARYLDFFARREALFSADEAQFRQMIDALPAAVYTTDAEGRLTHFNPACTEFSGRTPVLGSDAWCVSWKLYHADGTPMPHDQCPMAIALKEGRIMNGTEAIAERPDGSRIWFTPYPSIFRDEAGHIIGGVNMLVDITDRKQAEAANAYLSSIVQNSDDAIISKSLDGIITSWNQSAQRLFGYTAEEAIGKSIMMLIPPDRVDEEPRIIKRLKHGLRVDHFETKRRRKDGTLLDVSLTISPVKDAGGRIIGASKIARDITQQKADRQRVEADLSAMKRLHELGLQLAGEDDVEQIMRQVVAAAAELLQAPRCTAQLFDSYEQALKLVEAVGFDEEVVRQFKVITRDGITPCARVIASKQRVASYDLNADPEFAELAKVATPLGIGAVMSTPLLTADGALLGVFSVFWNSPHRPSEHELYLVDLYVQQAARHVERRIAEKALRESESRLETELADTRLLHRIAMALIREEDIQSLYEKIMDAAVHIMRCDFGSMQMLVPERRGGRGELLLLAHRGFTPKAAETWKWVSADSHYICGETLRRDTRVIVPDFEACDFMAGTPGLDAYRTVGIRSAQTTPLRSRAGEVIGMISTYWRTPHDPSERDLRVLDILARQAADLLERRRSEQDLKLSLERERQARHEAEVLNDVARTLAGELDSRKLLQKVTDAGTELIGAKFGAFFYNVINNSGESYRLFTLTGAAREDFEKFGMPRNTGVFGPTFRGEPPVRSGDIQKDPRYGKMAPYYGQPKGHPVIHSYLAAPVISRTGKVHGGLFFGHPDCDVFTERDERMIVAIAAQAAVAIDNAELFEQADREITERKRAESLQAGQMRVLELISSDAPLEEVLTVLVRTLESHSHGGMLGSILVMDADGKHLRHGASPSLPQSYTDAIDGVAIGESVGSCGTAAYRGEPVYVSDIATDPLWSNFRELALSHGLRACWSTPIYSSTGQLLGTFAMYYPESRDPNPQDLETVQIATQSAALAIERSRANETLRAAHAASDRQRRLYEGILANTPDLGYIFDLNHRFIYANEVLLKMWGKTWDEAIGKNCLELGYEPWHAEMHDREIEQVVATRKPIRGEVPFNGTFGRRIYDYIFVPVFGADGEVEAVAGTTRDVTDQKEHEKALELARQNAENANRAKDKFLAILSHELRTPLTPVMMSVTAMDMNPDLAPAIRDDIAMIRRNVELEVKLIDDLLDLSRVTSGKLRLNPEAIEWNQAVRDACHTCRGQILEKGIRLHLNLCDQPVAVNADPGRLQQIFWNLLRNAAKFTPEGGEIFVTTDCDSEQTIRMEMRDTGIGISPKVLPKIFDAFEQGEPSITREFGGMGLGLAISKALVELHHGKLAAQSEGPGKGSVFTVEFPRLAKPPAAPCRPQIIEDDQNTAKIRLLLVEDHADTAKILSRLLNASGYTVQVAHTVAAALKLADEEVFDILISDIGLPDATGYELMSKIKQRYPIKGIAMSGYGMEEDLRRSRDAGFSDHIVKPASITQLRRSLQRLGGIDPR